MSDDSNEWSFFDAKEFDDDGDVNDDDVDNEADINNMMFATGMDMDFTKDDDASFSTNDSSSESSMSTVGLMEEEIENKQSLQDFGLEIFLKNQIAFSILVSSS
jgi:hypothetical protein